MAMTFRPLLGVIAAVACSACGTAAPRGSSAPTTPSTFTPLTLTATAIAWSHAFLDGSPSDVKALLGTECSSNVPSSVVQDDLDGMRSALRRETGMLPEKIRITGVRTRNVTATSGEAEVEYDQPSTVVGNYNWVTYQVEGGRWKVADCNPPIGGVATTTPTATVTIP